MQTNRNVRIAGKTIPLDDDLVVEVQVVLSNDPAVIDHLVTRSEAIRPKVIRVFHHGSNATWTSRVAALDIPQGFICSYCHEPVYVYTAYHEETGEFLHMRELCGCTLIMMDLETFIELQTWLSVHQSELRQAAANDPLVWCLYANRGKQAFVYSGHFWNVTASLMMPTIRTAALVLR
jgi:hypothetical protein